MSSPTTTTTTIKAEPFPTTASIRKQYGSAIRDDAIKQYQDNALDQYRVDSIGDMRKILSVVRDLCKAVQKMYRAFCPYPAGTTLTWTFELNNEPQKTVSYTIEHVKSAEKKLYTAINNIYYYFKARGSKSKTGDALKKFEGVYRRVMIVPGPALNWVQNEQFGQLWDQIQQATSNPANQSLVYQGYCLAETYNCLLHIAAIVNNLKRTYQYGINEKTGKPRNVAFVAISDAMRNTFGNDQYPTPLQSVTMVEGGKVFKMKRLAQQRMNFFQALRQDSVSYDEGNINQQGTGFIDMSQRFTPESFNNSFQMYWFMKIKSLSTLDSTKLQQLKPDSVNVQEAVGILSDPQLEDRYLREYEVCKQYKDFLSEQANKSKPNRPGKANQISLIEV